MEDQDYDRLPGKDEPPAGVEAEAGNTMQVRARRWRKKHWGLVFGTLLVVICLLGALIPVFAPGLSFKSNQEAEAQSAKENRLIQSKFKQRYHYYNPAGFMNDVQTIWQDKNGLYHLIYLQNAKYKHEGDGTEWYQVTTKDFIHYQNVGVSIPKFAGSWQDLATGSILPNSLGFFPQLDREDLVAYFTSYVDGRQEQFVAYSKDGGKTFTPYVDHAIMKAPDVTANFRDPYVTYSADKHSLMMYLAEGDKIGTYRSDNGLDFHYVGGTMINADSLKDGMGLGLIECPNLKTLIDPKTGKTQHIMFFGANGYEHSQPTGTYYMVGHLNEEEVFVPDQEPERMDDGSDYYGANFMQENEGTILSLAWMGNWDYTSKALEDGEGEVYNLGSLSLAHRLTLAGQEGEYRVRNTIVEPKSLYGQALRGQTQIGSKSHQDQQFELERSSYQKMRFAFKPKDGTAVGSAGSVKLTLAQSDASLNVDYDLESGQYKVSRTTKRFLDAQGQANYSKQYAPVATGLEKGQEPVLHVLEDQSSVEFWFEGSGRVYSLTKFSTDKTTKIAVQATEPMDLTYTLADVASNADKE